MFANHWNIESTLQTTFVSEQVSQKEVTQIHHQTRMDVEEGEIEQASASQIVNVTPSFQNPLQFEQSFQSQVSSQLQQNFLHSDSLAFYSLVYTFNNLNF